MSAASSPSEQDRECWECGAENDLGAAECWLCRRRDWRRGPGSQEQGGKALRAWQAGRPRRSRP